MKLAFAIILATLYGLAAWIFYDFLPDAGVMSLSFFFFVPFAIGYLTILVIPYKDGQSATAAFFKPSLVCLVILIITCASRLEGLICWMMAFPLIAVMSGLGGVLAFNSKKKKAMREEKWDFEKDDRDRSDTLKVSLL